VSALPFDTARLRLRHLRVADLAGFQAYRSDVELARWQGWQPMDDGAAQAFLQAVAADAFCPRGRWSQIGIALPQPGGGDVLVGDIGLRLHESDGAQAELGATAPWAVELGITLARAWHGQGLAAEALRAVVGAVFAHTAAARVLAVSDTRNTASMALLPRAGLRRFATLAAEFRGAPCTEAHFVAHRPGRAAPVLRQAMPADALAVAAVLEASRRVLMPFVPSVHSPAETRAWVANMLLPAGGVTVAEVGGQLAGVLAVAQHGGVGWVEQLYVDPPHVGAGVGRALLAHALAVLPRPLRLYTYQPNLAAQAFYEAHGFEVIARGDGRDNEDRCPDLLYQRTAP
jgi:RimJ/RimL family protein N-acetyltransferase